MKPVSKTVKSGYLMLNVEPYGGLLHHTWFDRDLTVAGRVLVRQVGAGGEVDAAWWVGGGGWGVGARVCRGGGGGGCWLVAGGCWLVAGVCSRGRGEVSGGC